MDDANFSGNHIAYHTTLRQGHLARGRSLRTESERTVVS